MKPIFLQIEEDELLAIAELEELARTPVL